MKIVSTNLAQPTTFRWKGKEETTGIYKTPSDKPIYLTKSDVLNDEISDRKHYGGFYQACYVFSSEQYPYWKGLYPHLDWNWGMFGENLTLSDFDERTIFLGDIYKVGNALVQISQYREPCYKLGHKFGTQTIIKQFIERGYAGSYLSILEEGSVEVGDEFSLIDRPQQGLSVYDLFQLHYANEKDQEHVKIAAVSEAISQKKRVFFKSYI